MSPLFQPLQVGELQLPNRVIMAPLTRSRASEGRVPSDLAREYYVQRAGAGMILTEGTMVAPSGEGYPDTPSIYTEAQVAGWRRITDAVHDAGGRIVLQLWHAGRISDPIYLDGALPVAPSAIRPAGTVSLVRPQKEFVTPRALETDEIPGIVAAYRKGAENARVAGFDGVEVHGANGYLLDQFLQSGTNHRTDDYGGSLENRARLLLEVTDACIEVWGAGRVGMHLAPKSDFHDISDANPAEIFGYVARELGAREIAFICARESQEAPRLGPSLKEQFGGVFIANQSLTQAQAETLIEQGEADAAAWGQLFIANPDLPHRFESGAPLNEPNASTFYQGGAHGYTDYPALESSRARESVLG